MTIVTSVTFATVMTKFYDYENDLDLKLCFFRHEHGVADHHILVHILPNDELQHLDIYQIEKKKMKKKIYVSSHGNWETECIESI